MVLRRDPSVLVLDGGLGVGMTRYRVQIKKPDGEWVDYNAAVYTYDFMARAEVEAAMLQQFWPDKEFRVSPVLEEKPIQHTEQWL